MSLPEKSVFVGFFRPPGIRQENGGENRPLGTRVEFVCNPFLPGKKKNRSAFSRGSRHPFPAALPVAAGSRVFPAGKMMSPPAFPAFHGVIPHPLPANGTDSTPGTGVRLRLCLRRQFENMLRQTKGKQQEFRRAPAIVGRFDQRNSPRVPPHADSEDRSPTKQGQLPDDFRQSGLTETIDERIRKRFEHETPVKILVSRSAGFPGPYPEIHARSPLRTNAEGGDFLAEPELDLQAGRFRPVEKGPFGRLQPMKLRLPVFRGCTVPRSGHFHGKHAQPREYFCDHFQNGDRRARPKSGKAGRSRGGSALRSTTRGRTNPRGRQERETQPFRLPL